MQNTKPCPDRYKWRHFSQDVVLCGITGILWGIGFRDGFCHSEGHAFGGWALLIIGLGVSTAFFVFMKNRRKKLNLHGLFFTFILLSTFICGWISYNRVAAELWNVKCEPRWESAKYCHYAASKLGFFKVNGEDLLGQKCLHALCVYYPKFDRRSCNLVSRECTARRTHYRQYAFVDEICSAWATICKYRVKDGFSPFPQSRYPNWPPDWLFNKSNSPEFPK